MSVSYLCLTSLQTFQIPSAWNATDYQPHLFLKFSSMFDSLVEDILVMKDTIQYVKNDTADGRLGLKEAWKYAVKALNTTERDDVLRFVTEYHLNGIYWTS